MEPLKDQLERVRVNVQRSSTATTLPTLSAKQKLKLADAWQILLSRRLVTEPIGSDPHKVFELDMADLTPAQIDCGLLKSRDASAFPNRWFSTPAFRELCQQKPEDYGMPDAKTAMYEYCAAGYPKNIQPYSHPAVYLAGESVGRRLMEDMTEKELLPLYEHAYSVLVKRVLAGEDLKAQIPKALPKEVVIPCTPEQAKVGILKVRQMFMDTLGLQDTFPSGKWAGQAVEQVLEVDGSYLRWALKSSEFLFTDEVHDAVFTKYEKVSRS